MHSHFHNESSGVYAGSHWREEFVYHRWVHGQPGRDHYHGVKWVAQNYPQRGNVRGDRSVLECEGRGAGTRPPSGHGSSNTTDVPPLLLPVISADNVELVAAPPNLPDGINPDLLLPPTRVDIPLPAAVGSARYIGQASVLTAAIMTLTSDPELDLTLSDLNALLRRLEGNLLLKERPTTAEIIAGLERARVWQDSVAKMDPLLATAAVNRELAAEDRSFVVAARLPEIVSVLSGIKAHLEMGDDGREHVLELRSIMPAGG